MSYQHRHIIKCIKCGQFVYHTYAICLKHQGGKGHICFACKYNRQNKYNKKNMTTHILRELKTKEEMEVKV